MKYYDDYRSDVRKVRGGGEGEGWYEGWKH